MSKQPDAPETPPEIYRLRYIEDEETGLFFIESESLSTYLRETAEGLQEQGIAFGLKGEELQAAGMYGAAHVVGTIADQIILLPLQDDLEDADE